MLSITYVLFFLKQEWTGKIYCKDDNKMNENTEDNCYFLLKIECVVWGEM